MRQEMVPPSQGSAQDPTTAAISRQGRRAHSLPRVSDRRRLIERFVRLCEIPSPTGSERAVADAVAAELRSHGVEVAEDGAAAATGAGSGNLVARIPGRNAERWLMLCAHLDTVPVSRAVEVVESDGLLRSAGDTILGADDKAGVAAPCVAVAAMRLGRLDDETTANVGTIEGGTAANVVPGRCRIEAEARSLDADRASDAIAAIGDACTWAAGEHACDLDIDMT